MNGRINRCLFTRQPAKQAPVTSLIHSAVVYNKPASIRPAAGSVAIGLLSLYSYLPDISISQRIYMRLTLGNVDVF